MHKDIAETIEQIVEKSPYNDIICKVTRTSSNGFWKVTLYFESRESAHSAALVSMLRNMGLVFGEGLCIDDIGLIVGVS